MGVTGSVGVDVFVGGGGVVDVGVRVIVGVRIVAVGVIVDVLVAVDVVVRVGVDVGSGNEIGEAGRYRLQLESLNEIAKPKLAGVRLSGGFEKLLLKPPSQSTSISLLPRGTSLFRATEVVEKKSFVVDTSKPFHSTSSRYSLQLYRFDAVFSGPQSIVIPKIRNPG